MGRGARNTSAAISAWEIRRALRGRTGTSWLNDDDVTATARRMNVAVNRAVARVRAAADRDDFRATDRALARQELMAAMLDDACVRHADKLALIGGAQDPDCDAARVHGSESLVVWECRRALEQNPSENLDNLRDIADSVLGYALRDRVLDSGMDRLDALELMCGAEAVRRAGEDRGWEPADVASGLEDMYWSRLARAWLTGRAWPAGRDAGEELYLIVNPPDPD